MSGPGRLDQIGVVVRDLDRAAEGMRSVFGLEPHTRTENTYRRTEYRGREIDATVGVMLYDIGGVELELRARRRWPVGAGESPRSWTVGAWRGQPSGWLR